jgi:hypothetical protein
MTNGAVKAFMTGKKTFKKNTDPAVNCNALLGEFTAVV